MDQAYIGFASLLVKTAGDPRELMAPVLRELERLAPSLPINDTKSLAQQLDIQCYPTRIAAVCVSGFGLLALLLASVGVYGVMAYAVRRRTHELGVRTALEASRRQIQALVVRQGLLTTLAGVGVGCVGALGASRLLAKFLHGISSIESLLLVGVGITLGAAAWLACYLPARRATRIDPTVALRYE